MNPPELRRYQRYLLYPLILLLPLIITPTGRDLFRLGKEVFAQILMLGVVVLSGAEALQERRVRLPAGVLLPLGAFCAWSAASVLWTAVPPVGLHALFNLILFSLFLLALARLLRPEYVPFLFRLNLIPASITGLYTWIQYQGMDPLFITPQGMGLSGRENAGGLVGDVNTAGCYLALSLLLTINDLLAEGSTGKKAAVGAGCAAAFAGLIGTQTLTALGALMAGVAALAAANAYMLFSSRRPGRRLWVTVLLILLLALSGTALFVQQNESFRRRISNRIENLKARDWQALTSYRAGIFAVTWHMARERIWTGHGLNSFTTDFFDAKVRHDPGRRITMPLSIESTPRQAHNEFLQVWAELGLVGLLLLLATVGGVLRSGGRALSRLAGTEAGHSTAAALSACVGVLVAALGFFPAHLGLTGAWIVIPAGCLVALSRVPEGRPSGDRRSENARMAEGGGGWIPVAACGAAWLIGSFALLSPLLANERTGEAMTLVERVVQAQEPNTRVYLERGLYLLEQARRADPIEPQIYQGAGTAHWFLSQFEEALDSFSRAALLDPSPEAFTNLGETYRAMGRTAEAVSCYDTALRYDPDFQKARNARQLVQP